MLKKNFVYISSIIVSIVFLYFLALDRTVYADDLPEIPQKEETSLINLSDLETMPSEQSDPEKSSGTHPRTARGERLQYNVPYFVKDKNLPNRGGVTYQKWLRYDYAVFHNDPFNRGTPIVFESPDNRIGYISSNDSIIIKSVGSNWDHWVYWQYTDAMNASSVWFSNQRKTMGNIYGSLTDNSVGISMLGLSLIPGTHMPLRQYLEFHGGTGSTSWMTARVFYLNAADPYPPVEKRRTSFYIYRLHEL